MPVANHCVSRSFGSVEGRTEHDSSAVPVCGVCVSISNIKMGVVCDAGPCVTSISIVLYAQLVLALMAAVERISYSKFTNFYVVSSTVVDCRYDLR